MRKRIFLIHMLMLIGGMAILFAVIFGSVRQGIRGYMDSGEWISNVEDDAKAVLEKLEKTDGDWEVLAGELKNDHCALVVYEGDRNIYPADPFCTDSCNPGSDLPQCSFHTCLFRLYSDLNFCIHILINKNAEYHSKLKQIVKIRARSLLKDCV